MRSNHAGTVSSGAGSGAVGPMVRTLRPALSGSGTASSSEDPGMAGRARTSEARLRRLLPQPFDSQQLDAFNAVFVDFRGSVFEGERLAFRARRLEALRPAAARLLRLTVLGDDLRTGG